MNELVDQGGENVFHRLALQFDISPGELEALCQNIQQLLKCHQKTDQIGLLAVKIVRTIKFAIDLKFDKKDICSAVFPELAEIPIPSANNFKANLVRGMFLTFVEHPVGYPGFFDIVAGIAGAGMGMGKFAMPGIEERVGLAELRKHFPSESLLQKAQLQFLEKVFVSQKLRTYPNIRIACYSMLTACSLVPFYGAALKMAGQSSGITDEEGILSDAADLVFERFEGDGERMQKFMKQSLFRVLFEELLTHESTVRSIYTL